MPERRSALASAAPYRGTTLSLTEDRGFSLAQIACHTKDLRRKVEEVTGRLPSKAGVASETGGRVIMRIAPLQYWLIGPEQDDIAARLAGLCAVTPLSHSRTRIRIEGEAARDVLAKGMALDFHPREFKSGQFASTGLHHTPVLVHCIGSDAFHVYAMRTFAVSVWDWLRDAALEYSD